MDRSDAADLYPQVPERNSGDVLLRTAQQHHVQLSVMADTKANILITVSSLVLTVALGRLGDATLRPAMLTLSAFALLALMLAIIAVLPKYRPLRLQDAHGALPSGFNLLFFGHFAELPRQRFLTEVAHRLRPDGSVYRTMAEDLHSMGVYLAHHKYRYLRWSYIAFLLGFLSASAVAFLTYLRA